MIKRTIEISSPSRLSVANRQLLIERKDSDPVTVPIEDIGVLLLDTPAATMTHMVPVALAEARAALVICDRRHLPATMTLPVSGNALTTERHGAQVESSLPLRKRLWRELIVAKLRMQGAALAEARGGDAGLRAMAARVRSGDPDNLEAAGAQRYFRRLFGREFRRLRDGPPPNHLLNYGYTVVRAAVARSLCGSGLLPSLGVHHHHRNNAFALADDVLEPYRPFVDRRVLALVAQRGLSEDIDKDAKQVLLSVFNDTVPLSTGSKTPLALAIQRTTASLAESFLSGEPGLTVPSGMPVEDPPDDDADT